MIYLKPVEYNSLLPLGTLPVIQKREIFWFSISQVLKPSFWIEWEVISNKSSCTGLHELQNRTPSGID